MRILRAGSLDVTFASTSFLYCFSAADVPALKASRGCSLGRGPGAGLPRLCLACLPSLLRPTGWACLLLLGSYTKQSAFPSAGSVCKACQLEISSRGWRIFPAWREQGRTREKIPDQISSVQYSPVKLVEVQCCERGRLPPFILT